MHVYISTDIIKQVTNNELINRIEDIRENL
jgi:hypothetical protein